MNRLLALIAFATLAAFLGILAMEVPEIGLIAIICLTVALVAWDFITSSGSGKRR